MDAPGCAAGPVRRSFSASYPGGGDARNLTAHPWWEHIGSTHTAASINADTAEFIAIRLIKGIALLARRRPRAPRVASTHARAMRVLSGLGPGRAEADEVESVLELG